MSAGADIVDPSPGCAGSPGIPVTKDTSMHALTEAQIRASLINVTQSERKNLTLPAEFGDTPWSAPTARAMGKHSRNRVRNGSTNPWHREP